MGDLKFFAVCHAKMDSLNRGIARLGDFDSSLDPQNKIIQSKVNLITSFSHIYATTDKLQLPHNKSELMLDSGAYDFIIKQKNDTYPYDANFYFNTVMNKIRNNNIKLDYLVTMDYICYPNDKKGNQKRIDLNINNTIELSKIFEKVKPDFQLIPVVQGYELEEYLVCLKKLHSYNLIESHPYIGIGSIANRKKSSEAQRIVLGIISCLEKELGLKNIKIHLFGTSLNVIKHRDIASKITSFDSLAWTYPYLFGRVKMFTGKRMIELNTNKKIKEPEFYYTSLVATLLYVNYINLLYNSNKDIRVSFDKKKSNNRNNKTTLSDKGLLNNALTFTGDQLLFLNPKNVILSPEEHYFIFRNNVLNFMSYILSIRNFNRINQFLNDQRFHEILRYQKDCYLSNIIESLDRFTKDQSEEHINHLKKIFRNPYLNPIIIDSNIIKSLKMSNNHSIDSFINSTSRRNSKNNIKENWSIRLSQEIREIETSLFNF